MNKYRWLVKPPIKAEDLKRFPELPEAIVQLLFDRGLTSQEQIDEFLNPDYSTDIHDPYLFGQMKQSVDLVYQTIAKGEKIVIYGDYDADGVCGSAILNKVLLKLKADFISYLPDREKEGYGLNEKAVKNLAEQGIKLIITVDCGSSNNAEVALANSLGLKVIITDHHHLPEVAPEASAIIHPLWDKNYPFKSLAGGGVAFKLAQGLLDDDRSNLSPEEKEAFAKWLLDLVAISTVADMVPLIGENRTLVKYGLIVLSKTKNLGLQKLMEVAGTKIEKIDTFTIGFQLAPRINSAGRMDHANTAYKLLTTENIEEAITLAHGLNKNNIERQSQTEKLVTEAKKYLGESATSEPVLFAIGENWNPGLIGLVASKITQDFARPSFVLSFDGVRYVASGRSIKEFNLIEAMDKFSDYFIKYGGHTGAAGFSMKPEKLPEFKEKFTALVKKALKGQSLIPSLMIDKEITLAQANWDLLEVLELSKPYGEGNLRPKFLLPNLSVVSFDVIGQNKDHLRLLVKQGETERKIICFGFGNLADKLKIGQNIDAVCELDVNQWNGNREIQLSLIDIKESETNG